MINTQKPEPAARGDGQTLDVHSVFFTIQGEGPFTGVRSIFVRLAGCNLQCPGCDTEYTKGRETWKVRHLVTLIHQLSMDNNAPNCLVVITGGEPLRQNIGRLCLTLAHIGHGVQIESNGVFPPDSVTEGMILAGDAMLVVSPKTRHINRRTAELAMCFKYVLDAQSVSPDDGLPILALGHPAAGGVARPPHPTCIIYINPFDAGDAEQNKANLEAVVNSAKAHGHVMGVQLHKLVNLP